MYRELLELLAADRIIELVGRGKVEEMVERHAPLRALLTGGAAVAAASQPQPAAAAADASPAASDAAAVVADAVAAEAAAADTAAADAADATPGYLAHLLTTEGMASAAYQPATPDMDSAQLHIGRHLMLAGQPQPGGNPLGDSFGTVHVSIVDMTEQPVRWRERFVVDDLATWLDGGIKVDYDDSTPANWKPAVSERSAINSFTHALRSGTGERWSMQMTYRYTAPPGPAEAKALLKASGAMAKPPSRVLFTVEASVSGGLNTSTGWLLREVFGSSSNPSLIVDHWRLPDGWKPLSKTGNTVVSITKSKTGPDTLKTFLDTSQQMSANLAATGQKPGWYVRGAYKPEKTKLT